jgi:hypothetical protein
MLGPSAICCRGYCARDVVVEASEGHAAAEMLFEHDVQMAHDTASTGLCGLLQHLHERVVCGVVRRQVAAVAASRLRDLEQSRWRSSLLFSLLTASDHAQTCACVTHVLSWGTCPTVLSGGDALDGVSRLFSLWTAFGMVKAGDGSQSRLAGKWLQELLAYGSAPWQLIRPGFTGGSLMTLAAYGPPNPLQVWWQAQWWRWHARRARRLWVRPGVVLLDQ